MNELAAEWLHKAEGDYATAGREMRARRLPNYDAGGSARRKNSSIPLLLP